jgi:hypothetical protein
MIEAALNKLLRGTGEELKAYLHEVCFNHSIPNTNTISHCYHVHLDGNGRPRVNDFIDFIATKIVEYTIPRTEFEKAKQHLEKYHSDVEFAKLRRKAETLFTDLKNTGEGGEILLYILVQEFLKIPQLLCKMPLKTNSRMHYHGVDGIHAEFDQKNNVLALYWGESKLYKEVDQAVLACFNSLKDYLINPNGSESPQERDLQLIKDGLDLIDPKLEDAIVQYFNKDNPNFNRLQYRGVCLVGFDYDKYPSDPNKMVSDDLKQLVEKEIQNWMNSVSRGIAPHATLDTFHIHIFLIPFPSVEAFRDYFLKALHILPKETKSSKPKKVSKTSD